MTLESGLPRPTGPAAGPRPSGPDARVGAPEPEEPPSWREVLRGSRGRLAAGLFLLEATGAIATLVVTTIMPVIASDLGGIALYGWALAAPGLATVVAIPVTGRAAGRYGPVPVLAVMLPVFVIGLVMSAAAPSMPVLVVGRLLQGAGAGAQYAVSAGAVATSFPQRHRPRVMALLAGAWLVPGLIGPLLGAAVAQTIGWRWAFLVLLPLVAAAAALVLPGLRAVPAAGDGAAVPPMRWTALLAAGSAAVLAGLTEASVLTAPVVVVGVGMVAVALRRLTAADGGVASGLGWALLAGFLLTFSFFTADGFVPLMLIRVRGTTVLEAGVVVTAATVAWSAGSWWASRVSGRFTRRALMTGGAAVIGAGVAGLAAGLGPVPLAVPYLSWTVAGFGIGVAYPTLYVITMERAVSGAAASAVSLVLLLDSLGTSAGSGLGGAALAVSRSGGWGLRAGLMTVFALAFAGSLVLALICIRRAGPRAGRSATPGADGPRGGPAAAGGAHRGGAHRCPGAGRAYAESENQPAEDAMGLMDRVKEQAAQLAQMTQEAAQEGKVKLDQAQARRRADAMFRDLGAAVYAERTGRGGPDGADKIERLVQALSRQEAEQGLGEG